MYGHQVTNSLELGYDTSFVDGYGKTPMHILAEGGGTVNTFDSFIDASLSENPETRIHQL